MHTLYDYPEYDIYNISMSSGELISDSELIAAFQLSDKEYYQKAKEAAASSSLDYLEVVRESGPDEFVAEQYERSISDENIREAKLYIQNKHLYIVIKQYSIAGADYYWTPIDLNDYTLSEYYKNEWFY